ncbi:hypothetical protein [Microcoleus sp. D2_18a_B4]|uniref:hypothetical protein n=1 Tax=Microcoleus sp. D2_18a_B4 TaxID=3055329 RepID=UPI002FD4C17A
MNNHLSQYFSLSRRYSRSINIDRDLQQHSALEGYIFTEKAVEVLKRILAGLTNPESNRAWTLTGVYGTGKSAFAHYLASVCAAHTDPMRQLALEIAEKSIGSNSSEYLSLQENIPSKGLFRAVVTAQREPLSHTIVRALHRGAEVFWQKVGNAKKPAIARKLTDLETEIAAGRKVNSQDILSLVQEVASSAKTGVLLIIDELGKNLEFVAQNQGDEDLYLLQQLAELPRDSTSQIYIIGVLHQAFADYGERLASVERNEWSKIQGRFEDISFKDSTTQMMRLMGKAIDRSGAELFQSAIASLAAEWLTHLPREIISDISQQLLADTYPLHPVVALVLPELCTKYAQNDRSLFTFLTSAEPYSFRKYLDETSAEGCTGEITSSLPTLKLDRVYDYFIESVGMGITSRPKHQRWIEVQGLITDVSKRLDPDSLRVLKTIGTLNIISTTGSLRSTPSLVTLAMCNDASESNRQHWEQVIDALLQKGIITHFKQGDELRIWEGSDFNVDSAVATYLEHERSYLVSILSDIRPLNPLIAQRHSYKTGTLRYFERQYLDVSKKLENLHCSSNCDGLVGYWIDDELPTQVPSTTADGKPLIVLCAAKLDLLRMRAREFAALKKIQSSAAQLQNDGVARREVRYRVVKAEELLDETLNQTFDVGVNQNVCWIQGKKQKISHITDLNAKISDICDEVYSKKFILWNELINRRELTSQGVKARRELIEAMLEYPEQERLLLQGYGPEVSMYLSLLHDTGIHRDNEGEWGFYPPQEQSGVWTVWDAIENFCLQASEKQQTLDLLYKLLEAPPYGVKRGVIPVMLAAVLLYRVDDVGVYKDGTFIPVLGAEHFELLVKDRSRFSVKYFEVVGLRSQVFKELEAILRNPNAKKTAKMRNATLITVATPLFQFVKKLPAYTKKTKCLSSGALAVLQTLQQAQEPDELLFTSLPKACSLPPIGTGEADDGTTAKMLRQKLVQSLREIQTAYDELLTKCESLLYNAFAVRSNETKLREDLRVRSSHLAGQCIEPILKRFTEAAIDETKVKQVWLEALLMVVTDKPPESWVDDDITMFEIKLSDIARRFKNLEALQKEVVAKGAGFDALRITVTRPDGQEINQMVGIDRDSQDEVDRLVDDILAKLPDNSQIRQAVVAKLAEEILGAASQEKVAQIQGKPQNRARGQETSHP